MEIVNNIFFFIVAISILVAFHEFGHFWVARKVGVKVLRFSVGFGKAFLSFRRSPGDTEYVLSIIPLGGYVKMVDEREGHVEPEDLPYSFNRQPLWARSAIVAAGPFFNIILAVFLFWCVLVLGEVGMRPIVGPVKIDTLAAQAGFQEGEEIIAVDDKAAPTWTEVMGQLFSSALKGNREIAVKVLTVDEREEVRTLFLLDSDVEEPQKFNERLGLEPWTPDLKPVIGRIIEDGAAAKSGLKIGDLLLSADGVEIDEWMQWVEFVQARPEQLINLLIERDGILMDLQIVPALVEEGDKKIGKIGAAVQIDKTLIESLNVTHYLPPLEAVPVAFERTWFISISTLKMLGNMLIGKVSVNNLSGPISIAQYAGQTADMGLTHFLKYLALISVSLGVLNLLPVPVLDGGHLLFFLVEAIKGGPIGVRTQIYFQQMGMMVLMTLMVFAVFLDLERIFQ